MTDGAGFRECREVELLFTENIDKFNQLKQAGQIPDLRNCNLSGFDLRNADLSGLDFSGCYMRGCNLRGVDLTGCNLQGASLPEAQISGALFPENVTMDEVRASVEFGTRIRTNDQRKTSMAMVGLLKEIRQLLTKLAESDGE